MPLADPPAWAAAVFSARESVAQLDTTISHICAASKGQTLLLDVLINGNPELVEQLSEHFSEKAGSIPSNVTLQVWSIALPDKAGAWNRYLHGLWPGAGLTFFIDGYVSVCEDALGSLADFLDSHPDALSATGIPAYGRSAKQFRQEALGDGGLHGNLYALPENTITALRKHPFNLPLGIYRNDALLGAALAYAFNPADQAWNPKQRLGVCERVSWTAPEKAWWRLSDLRDQWRRRSRQVQGKIENSAIRQHLSADKKKPSEIPQTIQEWIRDWAAAHPDQVKRLCRFSPAHRKALAQLTRARDWSLASKPPLLMLRISDGETDTTGHSQIPQS